MLTRRIILAIRIWPNLHGWRDTALLALAYAMVGIPIGLITGRLIPEWPSIPFEQALAFMLITLLTPSLMEELLFRVLLIPHNTELVSSTRRWIWASISLIVFIVWHPFTAWLLHPWARPVFYDPVFLLLAGMLGLTCTLAYLRTGSIWPPVVIHWLTVVVWKLCLGSEILGFEAQWNGKPG